MREVARVHTSEAGKNMRPMRFWWMTLEVTVRASFWFWF